MLELLRVTILDRFFIKRTEHSRDQWTMNARRSLVSWYSFARYDARYQLEDNDKTVGAVYTVLGNRLPRPIPLYVIYTTAGVRKFYFR